MWGRIAVVVACLIAMPIADAGAQQLNLIFTTIQSPTAESNVRSYHAWADRINAEANGLFKIDTRDGAALVSNSDFYDRLRDNVVQISNGSLNYISGKFQLSVFPALPFLMDSAEEEAVVFWRVYKSGVLDSEFDELMPLFLRPYPQSILHFKKQPASLDSLNGLRIIASGTVPTQMITRLGGSPLSIALLDTYSALQRGVGDGLYFPWPSFTEVKLDEVTKYHVEAPLGGGAGGVWMMKKEYQSLPAAVRQVIDNNSGEAESRRAGRLMDEFDRETEKAVKASNGQTVVDLPPEQRAKWRAMVEPMLADWANTSPAHAKVLASVRAEVAKYRAEH